MDNQTDPATAGAGTPTDQPVYGPPPVETTSRGDDLNPNQGYRGPSNIGSWSQSVGAVPGAVASGVGAGLDQLAGSPAGHGENTFTVPQDSGLWKNFTDGLKTSDSANETELRQFSLQDSVDQARENINKAAGVDLPNPFVGAFAASPTAMQDYQRSLEELLAKHQENTPGDKAIRDAVEPALNMNDYADQWVKDAQSKSEMDLAKSNGSLFPWLAQHAGQMVGAFRNPINALGLLVGGPELGLGGSAVGRILQEGASQAAIQMGLTGVQEQSRQARAAQLGGETGFWPAIHDLEDSAIGGFIGGGVIRSLHEIGNLFRPADQGVATEEFLRRAQDIPPPGGWPAGSESRGQAWRREMDEWQAQQSASKGAVVPYEGPPGDAMGFSVEEGEAAPPAPPPSRPVTPTPSKPAPNLNTPPEIGNLPRTTAVTPTAIERAELDAAAAPKVPADNTPADALETYAGLLRSGEFPDQIGKPVLPPSTPPALPASDPNSLILPSVSETKVGQSFIKDDKPVTREDFDPTKLQTNADVFQYKGGGNAQGVTDRLKGVGMWDPIAGADPMVVYRWNDGREDVVNGHQRTGLARALDAQGSLPEGTTSPGFVFKEADGWTPADVRAYAAKVNLMQGSGDVLDTARILRDRPDIWDKALPTSEPKLKQAKGLAELSDDGWGMVVNGHVKPDLAALVGQGIPDKSAHTSMLQSIIDFKKADQNSTRMMIADANAAGFHEENQADIFGTAPVTKNLLQERAAVYSRVVTALREDKNVFRTLDREADRIEAAGNVLASDTNRNNADRAEQLGSILEKLAVRQGPISAALNRAAAGVAERGGKGADVAARQFLRDIDRLVREEGLKLTAPPEIEPRANIDITTPLGQDQSVEELRQSTAALSDDIFGSQSKSIPDQRQAIFEDMRQKLLDADVPPERAEANAAVIAARYVARASRLGRADPETLYREQAITVRAGPSGERPTYYASKEDGTRGAITIRGNSAVINLFSKANASTFMHEAGHKFLDEMERDAAEPDAPQGIIDDLQTVRDWMGLKEGEKIDTPQHEKFARGFEQYLREGKAPSEGLRRAFEQFKEWLRSIYRTLVGLGKEIPDSIRAVMDRMIATDDEIAAARAAEHEQLRTAPPTQQEAASAQLEGGIRDVATQVHDALRADGTPIDHEIADAIVKELKPAPVELGSTPPEREPAPRPGTKLDKTVDLRSSGLRPKGRGDGASSISAAQVAWSTAIQNKKPALAGIGAYGWKVLKPTEGLPYGNPYVEVTPEGVARFYGTDLQAGEKASSPNDAFSDNKYWSPNDEDIARAPAQRVFKSVEGKLAASGYSANQIRGMTAQQKSLAETYINMEQKWQDFNESGIHDPNAWAEHADLREEMDREVASGRLVKPEANDPAWYEKTDAGEQIGMPGVKPVTDADRAQFKAEQPLRGGDAAPPAGGLFDEDAKAQVDWMDLVPTDDGLVPANELREELRPQTPEEKTFFQAVKTPEELAIQRRQKAINLKVQQDLVKHFTTSRTIDGRRDIINANYNLFEDFGYSGHQSVRFIAEALVARSNQQIAAALEHFKRKTFYSNGPLGLAGTRNNRADLHELRKAMGGEKTTPEMQKLAQDMRVMLDDGLRLFNEASGGTIGYLKNWVPQNHNPAAIYRAGGLKNPLQAKAAWIKYIDPLLNWDEMRDTQTGAFLKGLSEAQRGAILDWTWKTIVTDGSLQDRPGGHRLSPASVANSRSDHRFFIFKNADSQSDYDKNYGGGDFLTQLLTHSRMMARDTALMRVFGTNPANMIAWAKDGIVKEAAKAAVSEPSLLEGYDKMSAKQLLAEAARAGKVIDGYYAQFRGNGYEQGTIALAGTVMRNIETSALLGKSVIPHAVANPLIQMMGRYYGKVPVMQTLPHLAQAFRTASKEEMLRSGLDVENGAYSLGESARYIGTLERVANASRWLPDRVTAWSGLHPFVEAMRGTLRRGMVANLADLQKTDWNALPAWTLRKLQGYGVTERDWKIAQLADLYEPALGSAKWLRPADIEAVGNDGPNGGAAQRIASAIGFRPADMFMTPQEEAALKKLPFDAALKISGYINGETEVAVPTSSMRMRASLVGDSDPNTLWGQLRLSTVMFKGFIASFMLSQLQANARLAADHAPSALNWKVGRNRFSLKHAAFLTVAMSLAGTLSFILKQMASGKEIPSLDPMSPEGRKTWEHGVLTGGAFGYLGDFLASQQSSYGRGPLETLAGPAGAAVIGAGGSAWDAFTSATTKRGPARSKKTMEQKAVENMFFAARNNTPFGNLWYGQAAFNRMVLDQLQQMADPSAHQEAVQAQVRLMKESNQKFWWNPGDRLPHEWPWQHAQ